MNSQKIILVSNAFYPEISPRSFRATELAKEFTRQGHKVTVITKFRRHDYSDFLNSYGFDIKMWSRSLLPKFPVVSFKVINLVVRSLERLLTLLFEYPSIEEMFKVKSMLNNEAGYSLMISFAVPYPVHWGTALARSEKNIIAECWVADCGDPYMGDRLDTFRHPFYFKYLEKLFCRRADYISIPVHSAIQAYYPEFHNKIVIIPQGFEFNLDRDAVEQKNPCPTFAYAGRFLKTIRDPVPLLNYLVKIKSDFRFYVYTDQPELLQRFKSQLSEKLIVSGFIDRDELMSQLSKMDFLINFDNNSMRNVPSKLIDYAIANRPVLNIGRPFNPEDLDSFMSKDYSKRMILPPLEIYHISNIATQFLKLAASFTK